MEPALIVSPHFDDAVLSVGQVMAGRPAMTVATIFAGCPARSRQQTTYDRDCGFGSAEKAIRVRRREDRQALETLRAHPVWLDFVDHQYNEPADEDSILVALTRLVAKIQPKLLLGPLGLSHADHHAARRVYQRLASTCDIEAWIYEDLPYRVVFPEEVPEALAWWKGMGHRPELGFVGTGPPEKKQTAVSYYRSQLWALDHHSCLVAERVWRLW